MLSDCLPDRISVTALIGLLDVNSILLLRLSYAACNTGECIHIDQFIGVFVKVKVM